MKRNLKPLIVLTALALALVLTITRRDSNRIGLGAGGPSSASPSGASVDKNKPYDLSSLHVFNAALMRINDAYVDPTRVDPKAMLLASLDYVQKSIAEVLVEPHADQNRVVVRVDTVQKDFKIDDVDSPWSLSLKMREIFKFIAQNLQPNTDVKDVEYNATNGMLSTLDPHSMLLDPTQYADMKMTTKGSFGGLGIVIGIRKNLLTVIKPMPNTPASEAGIKAGDHIVRIEKEPTEHMMLNDAVSRLRGDDGTKVEVWIQRATEQPRKLVLTRAVIQVDNIVAQLLKNNIGYVRLKQFSGNSVEEMRAALDDMKAKGPLKGIILDLRGDPGGLLDQAIKVADEFVDSGTIVTTVGYANKQRDEKRASPGGQPHIPMVVLINNGSASASEIVAGALKNLDRAVIIGQRSFGKGSVQVLYDNDDGSALKLTIAQYLTPGDVSIQSVGIVPDVRLEPTALSKDRVAIFRPNHSLRENDLDAHLTSKSVRVGDKPVETLRYLAEDPRKKKDKDKDSKLTPDLLPAPNEDDGADEEPPPDDDVDKFVEDYEISLARDLLSNVKQGAWRRREVLAASKPFFEKKAGEEQQKIVEGLKSLGVDWSGDARGAKPQLAVTFTTDKTKDTVAAGEPVTLEAKVTNKGSSDAVKVRAIAKSDDPLVDGREFVFGRIKPGETRTWSVPVKVEKGQLTRLDPIRLDVFADQTKIESARLGLKIDGMQHPRFAYSYQLIDDVQGNGDGLVQKGESARLHVTVKNVGEGRAYDTLATLTNKSGDGIVVNNGRYNIDNLKPGESKSVDFTFDVTQDFGGDNVALEMDIYDSVLHEFVTDRVKFPLAQQSASNSLPAKDKGALTVTADNAELHSGASNDTQVVGRASHGARFPVTGRFDSFYRVEIEPGRPAFLAAAQGQVGGSMGVSPPLASNGVTSTTTLFTPSLQVMPPGLTLDNPPLASDSPSFTLRGTATDDKQVTDVFIFVSNRGSKIDHRKVYYRSNRKSQNPRSMRFEASIPLWSGANTITVVARQSNQVQSQQTIIVQGKGDSPLTTTADAGDGAVSIEVPAAGLSATH